VTGVVQGAVRLGQLPLTSAGLQIPRRLTQGISGLSAREPHVELALVERGISVRAVAGQQAWVGPVAKADEEPLSVVGRGRIVPPTGWMVFFDEPSGPGRVALLGRTE